MLSIASFNMRNSFPVIGPDKMTKGARVSISMALALPAQSNANAVAAGTTTRNFFIWIGLRLTAGGLRMVHQVIEGMLPLKVELCVRTEMGLVTLGVSVNCVENK